MTVWRGLTWDHPRGYAALERAAMDAGGIIQWSRQPLEGFESAPIEDVCAGYDLVVLDHPHLGDAVAAGCLQPIDSVMPAISLAAIRERTLGSCYTSYEMDGHLWALPLDAAAQVSAGRPDLMSGAWPSTYDELARASQKEAGFVMSLAGPHAFLSLLSLCAGLDRRFGTINDGYFQPHHDKAIDLFLSLAQRSAPAALTENPIGILTGIAEGRYSFCPLVFGYVPFASSDQPFPVTFRDVARHQTARPPCGVLGGTGIGITKACQPDARLVSHLEWLLSPDAQCCLIPANSGQPSAEAAWASTSVNAEVQGFYAQTIETLRHAFVRPRHQGFVPLQTKASAWLRTAIGRNSAHDVRAEVNSVLAAGKRDG